MNTSRIHEMKLADEYFDKIASGKKTVEVRLFDEKRRLIAAGDKIIFSRMSGGEKLEATVVALRTYPGFKELFSREREKTGVAGLSAEDAASLMYSFYTRAKEREYGVLAIEIAVANT